MKKHTFATIAASALAALSIGLAAPAFASPTGPSDDDTVNTPQTTSDAYSWWHTGSQTPYGTYQNDDRRPSGSMR